LPRLHGKDEELARVQFRASPKTEERRGDGAMVVVLDESDAQAWRAGKGVVEDGVVLPIL
jgi:hypothetical protein